MVGTGLAGCSDGLAGIVDAPDVRITAADVGAEVSMVAAAPEFEPAPHAVMNREEQTTSATRVEELQRDIRDCIGSVGRELS
ncbi:MAG: hypothetical protein V3V01_01520 [Acidimicrobiales bacterium]